MIDLDQMRRQYTPQPVPPCRVCGATMKPGEFGPGSSVWYCSAVRDNDRTQEGTRHYWASRIEIVNRADTRVIKLLNVVEAAQRLVEAETAFDLQRDAIHAGTHDGPVGPVAEALRQARLKLRAALEALRV